MSKTLDDRLREGRQYRDFQGWRDVRTLDDGRTLVEGYATVFNTPYVIERAQGYVVREQIDPGAFDGCDCSDVIMQYDHAGHVYARISNGTLEIEPDGTGLNVRAYIGGTTIGRQLFEEIQGGYTTKMSFGFIIGERRKEVTENRDTGETEILITITKITKLFDVSAVSLPANDATTIHARTYGSGVIAEVEAERLKRKRKLATIRLLLED